MSSFSVSTATLICAGDPLGATDLARACGAGVDWVVQLVEVGIVAAPESSAPPEAWRFQSSDLQHALEARRLERDFGVSLDAAALILDLQHELRRLKAVLAAQGLERSI